jgi:hypothetical protein
MSALVDYDFLLRLCRRGPAGYYPLTLLRWRQRGDSITHLPANQINRLRMKLKTIVKLQTESAAFELTDRESHHVLEQLQTELANLYYLASCQGVGCLCEVSGTTSELMRERHRPAVRDYVRAVYCSVRRAAGFPR